MIKQLETNINTVEYINDIWCKLNKEKLIEPIVHYFTTNTYGTPTIYLIESKNHKNIIYMGWSSNDNEINKFSKLLFLKNIDFFC